MTGCRAGRPGRPPTYDPWRDLRRRWPEVEVVVRSLRGDLLGLLDHPVITLRAGTSAAQRRCTLAHEIVHLERGVTDCGAWLSREERTVHAIAAARLLPVGVLTAAIRDLGLTQVQAGPALAAAGEVDLETLTVRLAMLTPTERAAIAAAVRALPRSA